mgnify:CR=1 FL=1
MSERKINLEEILNKELNILSIRVEQIEKLALKAMKEACKQVLELAAENAKTSHNYYDKWDENEAYNKHKDFGFERCDGDGIPYGVDVITINKQSIIDTINLVH